MVLYFFWSRDHKTVWIINGGGVVVANWLIGMVAGVESFNNRVMKVNIVIGDIVWEIIPCYFQQVGISVNEKEEFYELTGKVVTKEKVFVAWVVALMAMLVVIWVVLERLMAVLRLGK